MTEPLEVELKLEVDLAEVESVASAFQSLALAEPTRLVSVYFDTDR